MQQQSFENWNNSATDDDYEKLKDAMVLLIEKAIADAGNETAQPIHHSVYNFSCCSAYYNIFDGIKPKLIKLYFIVCIYRS